MSNELAPIEAMSKPEPNDAKDGIKQEEPQFGACLVVGGCGFLGHHIVKRLLREPTVTSIAVMSRSPFKNRFEGVTYHIGDITKREHVEHVMVSFGEFFVSYPRGALKIWKPWNILYWQRFHSS
jgi:hypothetical protein